MAMKKNIDFREPQTSPDGRFRLELLPIDSDHFYILDMEWKLVDTKIGSRIKTFIGHWATAGEIQSVEFSKIGKEVIAKDDKGKVVE